MDWGTVLLSDESVVEYGILQYFDGYGLHLEWFQLVNIGIKFNHKLQHLNSVDREPVNCAIHAVCRLDVLQHNRRKKLYLGWLMLGDGSI